MSYKRFIKSGTASEAFQLTQISARAENIISLAQTWAMDIIPE